MPFPPNIVGYTLFPNALGFDVGAYPRINLQVRRSLFTTAGRVLEAVGWWRKAAEQGYAKAQFNLGIMYGNGRGVPQDYVEAHMWFNLADG